MKGDGHSVSVVFLRCTKGLIIDVYEGFSTFTFSFSRTTDSVVSLTIYDTFCMYKEDELYVLYK